MSEIYNDTYCVYAHINKTNGKIYVGQTCIKPEKRWNYGRGYKGNGYFYKAIQKYGWDNFEHEIVASNLTKSEADNFERTLIKKLDLLNPNKGYNLQDGGAHGRPSEISKINIKNAAQKRGLNEEYRLKQSRSHIGLQVGDKNGMYGKKHTEEARKKQREASLGKHPSDETRKKMSEAHSGQNNSMFGKTHSDETRKKISDALKNENHPKSRQVNQYSLDGVFIKTWDYMKQATKSLGIPYQNISRCCRTEQGTAGGFIWRYTD